MRRPQPTIRAKIHHRTENEIKEITKKVVVLRDTFEIEFADLASRFGMSGSRLKRLYLKEKEGK